MTESNTITNLSDIVFSIIIPLPESKPPNIDLDFVLYKFSLKTIADNLTPIHDGGVSLSNHTSNSDYFVGNTLHISLRNLIEHPHNINETILDTKSINLCDLIELLHPTKIDLSLNKTLEDYNINYKKHQIEISPIIELFTLLVTSLTNINIETLASILSVAKKTNSPLQTLITPLLMGQITALNTGNTSSSPKIHLHKKDLQETPALQNNSSEFIKATFKSNGYLSKYITDYEVRSEQIEMSEKILKCLKKSEHLIIEAGTGTGKSLAYLLPAFLQAMATDIVTVISTNTINLQEQLIHDDIPLTIKCLESSGANQQSMPNVALLKGKSNYICIQKLENLLKTDSFTKDDSIFLIKLLIWITKTETGDKSELNFNNMNQKVLWDQVSEENSALCKMSNKKCFFKKAKDHAAKSNLIITNHSLLMADITSDGVTIPPYNNLIIDEAHHLEEQATKSFGFQINDLSINELIEKSGNPDSIMGTSIKILRPIVNINELDLVDAISEDISTTLDKLKINTITLFDLTISEPNQNEFPDSYRQIRITDQIRTNNWHSLEQVTENILLQINTIINAITSFNRIVESRSNQSIMLNIYNDLSALKNDLYEISEKLNEFIFEPDKDAVYWIEKDQKNSKLTFCMAPIEVSQILHEKLFSDKNAVVLTSATLSANQSFEHIKSRLGFLTDNAEIYDSPFDYIDSTFMLMPKSIPDPREEAHIDHVCQSIAMACISMQGRALALFTSYSSIRKAYENLKPVMEKRNIEVLAQGISGSPKQLVNHLRENPHTLLLGTSSMWEGIDIKGESLQVLIMTRLPFAVPTDPIYQARSEKYKNPFMEFAIPTAILKFRQGFGRLIRSNNDRGVFIMLDNRINTKKYGEMFLNSLPAMKRQKYDNNQITNMIKKWLV